MLVLLTAQALAASLVFSEADGQLGFVGSGSLGAFAAVATRFSGTVDPASGAGELVVPVLGLRTHLGPRDSRMQAWCLDAERFPELRFTLTGGPLREGGTLRGRLTVRDITREVEIPASIAWEGPNLHLKGRFEMDWREWQVPDPSVVIGTMDPILNVNFDLVARPS